MLKADFRRMIVTIPERMIQAALTDAPIGESECIHPGSLKPLRLGSLQTQPEARHTEG